MGRATAVWAWRRAGVWLARRCRLPAGQGWLPAGDKRGPRQQREEQQEVERGGQPCADRPLHAPPQQRRQRQGGCAAAIAAAGWQLRVPARVCGRAGRNASGSLAAKPEQAQTAQALAQCGLSSCSPVGVHGSRHGRQANRHTQSIRRSRQAPAASGRAALHPSSGAPVGGAGHGVLGLRLRLGAQILSTNQRQLLACGTAAQRMAWACGGSRAPVGCQPEGGCGRAARVAGSLASTHRWWRRRSAWAWTASRTLSARLNTMVAVAGGGRWRGHRRRERPQRRAVSSAFREHANRRRTSQHPPLPHTHLREALLGAAADDGHDLIVAVAPHAEAADGPAGASGRRAAAVTNAGDGGGDAAGGEATPPCADIPPETGGSTDAARAWARGAGARLRGAWWRGEHRTAVGAWHRLRVSVSCMTGVGLGCGSCVEGEWVRGRVRR